MNYLKGICILFLLSGCQVFVNEHPAIGTWSRCNRDGSYWEYKITDQYMLMTRTLSNEVLLFKTKVVDTSLLLSEFKNGPGLMYRNDTLVTIEQSENKIVLKSTYTWETLELNKADFDIESIDSLHLEAWKSKTLADFKKRAALMDCPDIRTEEEKVLPILETDDSDEEIEIIEIDSLGGRKRLYFND